MLSACACRQMQLIHTFDAAHLEICLGVWGFWWKRQWCPPLSLCSINSCRWKQPHTSSTSSSELNFIINTPNQQLLCLGYVLLLPHHKNLSVRLQKKKKTAVGCDLMMKRVGPGPGRAFFGGGSLLLLLFSGAPVQYSTKTLFQLPPTTILYMPCDVMMSIATTVLYCTVQQ